MSRRLYHGSGGLQARGMVWRLKLTTYCESVFDSIVSIIEQGGYLGIFLLMFLENVFPPIPSELIMPMGGLLAERGDLQLSLVVVAGTLGSLLGQSVLYYAGRRLGPRKLKRWAREHGHWVAISEDEVGRTQAWFGKRRGSMAVFLGRLVPGIRSLISIPAGLARMPAGRFHFWTLLGTGIWAGALAAAGELVANNYDTVEAYLNPLTTAFMVILVGSYLRRVARSFRHDSSQPAAEPSRMSSRRSRHA